MNNGWLDGRWLERTKWSAGIVMTHHCLYSRLLVSDFPLHRKREIHSQFSCCKTIDFNKVFGSNMRQLQMKWRTCDWRPEALGSCSHTPVLLSWHFHAQLHYFNSSSWCYPMLLFLCGPPCGSTWQKTWQLPVTAGQTNIYSDNKQCTLWAVFCKPSSWVTCIRCSKQEGWISTPVSYS